jgi:hypothetical protein
MVKLNGLSLVMWIALAFAVSSCSKLKEGVNAYYQGDYDTAIKALKKIANKAAKKSPEVKISIDENTTVEQALPHATKDYFDGWQAYAGSHFALNRMEDGCRFTKLALRPIKVKIRREPDQIVDPREGEYWQAEVRALRAWELNIPCP